MSLIAQFGSEFLAQADAAIPGGLNVVLFGYGPLGAFCWWLTRLVERMRRDGEAEKIAQREELAARDALLREITAAHTEAMGAATHKIAGLSRALVYQAATLGTGSVKAMAQREVDRWEQAGTG